MNPTLIINEELKSLLPPLSDAEYTGLEANILNDGRCNMPLTVWGDLLVDGHHRYSICQKHQIPFTVDQREFESLDDAKIWIGRNQMHRRNSTVYHRAELALKLKPSFAAKAKERQGTRHDLTDNIRQNSAECCMTTSQELAKIADVSHDTLKRVAFITEYADEETKLKLRKGESGISINKVYENLKTELQQAARKAAQNRTTAKSAKAATTATATDTTDKTEASDATRHTSQTETASSTANAAGATPATTDDDEQPTGIGLHCRPGEQPGSTGKEVYVNKVNLKDLPSNRPDVLIGNVIAHFPHEYLPGLLSNGFEQMCAHEQYGQKEALTLVRQILEGVKRYKETKRQ